MTVLAIVLIGIPVSLVAYAYLGYPLILMLMNWFQRDRAEPEQSEWPLVSLSIPAYNEEESIRDAIENVLTIDYPRNRLEIVIVSDASTDRTDEIVREFADRGVSLLRLPERRGKTAAENAVATVTKGDIIVNTDATTRIERHSLKVLVSAFADPSVGVASGTDVSVGDGDDPANRSESGYTSYEMWVRALETRAGSIIGASGCFYATRRHLQGTDFPPSLSRDFASALIAIENGYRAVAVPQATCRVPRTASLRSEYNRKIRTMARGLETLWFKRRMLNPLRYGRFAFMLMSHKVARWLVQLTMPGLVLGVVLLSFVWPGGKFVLLAMGVGVLSGLVALRWPAHRRMPAILELSGFAFAANLAGLQAWLQALRGHSVPTWEPTRRAPMRSR